MFTRAKLKELQQQELGLYIDIPQADEILNKWSQGQPITNIANYQPLSHFIQELRKLSPDNPQGRELYLELCRSQIQSPDLFYSYAILFYELMSTKITMNDVRLFNETPYAQSKGIRLSTIPDFRSLVEMMHKSELNHYEPNSELEETLRQALYYTTVGWARDKNPLLPSNA